MWTKEELAYMAGIIDGEGSISVDLQRAGPRRKHDYYSLRLCIVNINKELMDWIVKVFGGSCYVMTKYEGCKITYCYRIFGDRVLNIVNACHPYMIVKRPHAEIVREFRKTVLGKTNWNIPDEILEQRRILYFKAKDLNKKGDHETTSPLSP